MIIKDKEGIPYNLGKSRLTTLENDEYAALFYIKFKDIREHYSRSAQLYIVDYDYRHFIRVPIRPDSGHIGCRKFDDKTMKLIMKAIKGKRVSKPQRNKKKS